MSMPLQLSIFPLFSPNATWSWLGTTLLKQGIDVEGVERLTSTLAIINCKIKHLWNFWNAETHSPWIMIIQEPVFSLYKKIMTSIFPVASLQNLNHTYKRFLHILCKMWMKTSPCTPKEKKMSYRRAEGWGSNGSKILGKKLVGRLEMVGMGL